jgi:hypothetical protein
LRLVVRLADLLTERSQRPPADLPDVHDVERQRQALVGVLLLHVQDDGGRSNAPVVRHVIEDGEAPDIRLVTTGET